jgi:thiamine-phosphate diphosphorylase
MTAEHPGTDRTTPPGWAFEIYLVTDTALCGGHDGVLATAAAAARGGATAVQLRDPAAPDRELAELGGRLIEALAGSGVPLIVNDRVEVAAAIGAAGAHVGQSDLDPIAARRLLGPGRHLGLSVTTVAEAQAAARLPAGTVDLLGVGPIRDTPSKPDAAAAVGWDGFARIRAAAPIPCVAIGGVSAADADALRSAGGAGMAVISAICGQPDPGAAAGRLRAAWDAAALGAGAR